MGNGTVNIAVSDAGPLIHLREISCLSLGIIVRAYRSGHISLDSAKHHIANLYDISSLFVTRTIVELAIEQLSL